MHLTKLTRNPDRKAINATTKATNFIAKAINSTAKEPSFPSFPRARTELVHSRQKPASARQLSPLVPAGEPPTHPRTHRAAPASQKQPAKTARARLATPSRTHNNASRTPRNGICTHRNASRTRRNSIRTHRIAMCTHRDALHSHRDALH